MWYHTFYRKFIWKQRKEPYNYLKSANFITMIIITHENKGGGGQAEVWELREIGEGLRRLKIAWWFLYSPLKVLPNSEQLAIFKIIFLTQNIISGSQVARIFFIILFTLMLHYGDKCVTKSSEHPDLLFQILKFRRWFVFGHLLYIMCEPIVISFIFFYAKIHCVLWLYAYFGLVNP